MVRGGLNLANVKGDLNCATPFLAKNCWTISPVYGHSLSWKSCSVVFSITMYDTDKTDKLRHIANMYLTVNSSN